MSNVQDKRTYYTRIPEQLFYDTRCKADEIAVYGVLDVYANRNGESFPSISSVAKLIGRGVTRTRKAIHNIKDFGYIIITERKIQGSKENDSNLYTLIDPLPLPEEFDLRKIKKAIGKNAKGKNKSIPKNSKTVGGQELDNRYLAKKGTSLNEVPRQTESNLLQFKERENIYNEKKELVYLHIQSLPDQNRKLAYESMIYMGIEELKTLSPSIVGNSIKILIDRQSVGEVIKNPLAYLRQVIRNEMTKALAKDLVPYFSKETISPKRHKIKTDIPDHILLNNGINKYSGLREN